jgi:signal transduction histidine kinase
VTPLHTWSHSTHRVEREPARRVVSCTGRPRGVRLISTGFTGARRRIGHVSSTRITAGGVTAVLIATAVLAFAGSTAQHTLLSAVGTLGLFAAGVAFLLRWRVTSTAATRQVGAGLLLLGLHRPVAVVVDAVLHHELPRVATAAGAGVVLVAAGATLRAFPCRGIPPVWRLSRRASALLAASSTALLAIAASPLVPLVTGLPSMVAGAAWLAVAVAAWRNEPLAVCERAPARAMAGLAVLVGMATTARAVLELWPTTSDAVRLLIGLALVAAAATAVLTALRRLTAALAGQERYVSGLLEQLAGHERQLQEARACLHDARAVVAGIRAASSAVRHLDATRQSAVRVDLEESVAVELARLARMLRLPERAPRLTTVGLDQVVRAMVTSHRERGLRVSWAPSAAPPVTVDGDALAVILGNLLGNALAHAPRALCQVDVEVTDRLTVVVADDGPGLSPAGRGAAFEVGARRSGSPGEGLGLAISRDLARRHGGDLVAVDVPVGTCFVLTLPVQPATPPVALPRPRVATDTLMGAGR